MSNIVPVQGAGIGLPAVPAYLQNPALTTQSSMADFATGGSTRRVQLKGGQVNFLAEDGKPMGIVSSQDGGAVHFPQYVSAAEVVIVGMNPTGSTVYRTWYAAQYKDGDTAPPDCWSADGLAPDAKAASPQATSCADCPKNVSGTSSTGRGKACGSRKKLAVYFARDPERRLFQMDLSSTALFGKSAREDAGYYTLAAYARMLKQHNIPWEAVITEVAFAEGANIGVRFRAVGYLTQQEFEANLLTSAEQTTRDVITVDFPAPAAVTETPPTTAYQDPKAALLAHPQFPATWRDWALNPAVTVEAIRQQLAANGIHL